MISKFVRSPLSISPTIGYIDANKQWDPNTKWKCGSKKVWMMITMTDDDDVLGLGWGTKMPRQFKIWNTFVWGGVAPQMNCCRKNSRFSN